MGKIEAAIRQLLDSDEGTKVSRLLRIRELCYDRLVEMKPHSSIMETVMPFRDGRQQAVFDWAKRCFGVDHATSIPQRGVRLGEEAIELCQAAGVDRDIMHNLVDFVYDRPVGDIGQELGGVGVCMLALARAAGLSAETEEVREVERILSKTPEHFRARNAVKDAAGFNVTGAYPTEPV